MAHLYGVQEDDLHFLNNPEYIWIDKHLGYQGEGFTQDRLALSRVDVLQVLNQICGEQLVEFEQELFQVGDSLIVLSGLEIPLDV